MTKGRGVFPFEIGCWDPRSQKRDLGHPSIVADAANGVIAPLTRLSEPAARDDKGAMLPWGAVAGARAFFITSGGPQGPGILLHLRISPCSYEIGRWIRRQVLIAIDLEVKRAFHLQARGSKRRSPANRPVPGRGPLRLLKRPVINSSGVLAAVSRIA